MLDQDSLDYWFGPPQLLLTSVPGVMAQLPLCKVAAVGMGTENHDALELHIRWHTFGHIQTRPGP
jgi:hypothetical protein